LDQSPEQQILSLAVSVIAEQTNQKVSGQLPSWVISSFEIDIDATSDIGAGGFGTVRKGTWNGLVVAVKQMTRETLPKVRPPML
jgi:hypothetical protein